MAPAPKDTAGSLRQGGPDRLGTSVFGLSERCRPPAGGQMTGPNLTDKGKLGDDHRVAGLLQSLEARLDIGEPFQVVVLSHDASFWSASSSRPAAPEGVVGRVASNLLEVFVFLHRGKAEGVLQQFLSSHLRDVQRLGWVVLLQLSPNADQIHQRAVHVERQRFR